jgi:hypothetical protein
VEQPDYLESIRTTLDVQNATSITGFTIPAQNIQYDIYKKFYDGGSLTLRSITELMVLDSIFLKEI